MTRHEGPLNPAEIWAGGDSDAKGIRRTVSVTAIHAPTGIEVTHASEKPGGHTRREARVARGALLARCLDELEVAVRDQMHTAAVAGARRALAPRPVPWHRLSRLNIAPRRMGGTYACGCRQEHD
jgi:hypothetical protein